MSKGGSVCQGQRLTGDKAVWGKRGGESTVVKRGEDVTVEAWEAGIEKMKGMAGTKWEGGRMLKGIMGTKQNRDFGAHFLGRARLTRLRPGALQARYVHDRVRAAEAHELGAAPQRFPQRSRLLAEAPLTLPEARQAQHPQRLPSGHSAEQGPEAAFSRAEIELREGAEPSVGTTLKAGLKASGHSQDKAEG